MCSCFTSEQQVPGKSELQTVVELRASQVMGSVFLRQKRLGERQD